MVSDATLTDSVVVNLTINGVNDSPVITQGPGPLSLTVAEDGTVSQELNATDVDSGTSFTWSLSGAATNGTAGIDSSTGLFTYSPDANYNGNDSATVMVSDGVLSDSLVINLTVTPVNDAPEITQGNGPLSYTLNEDSNLTFDLNASDLEGDVLAWSIGSNPSNGTATVDSTTGLVTYVPSADYEGNDTLTVTVSDATLTDSVVVNLTINGVNDSPVITQGPGPLSLTVAEDGTVSQELNATDVDSGTSFTWSLTGAATNGTAGIDSSTGLFTYSPDANYYGNDSATVMVSDGVLSDSLVINLTVTPVNDAPEITQGNGPLSYTLNEDSNLTFDLNASDLEGDVLAWSIGSNPSNGTATVDSGTGLVTYAPSADYEGNDTLTVMVSDATLTDSVVVNLTINGVNDSPVITQGPGPLFNRC